MTGAEEQEVIRLVLEGDSNAFEKLVLDNQTYVYNLALRMTGNESDALDVSQDAFIKAYSNLENYRGESRFSVWLYRLTYNLCIDFIRKRKRNATVPLAPFEDEEDRELDIPDIRYSPERVLERKELTRTVRGAMELLSQDHRQILIMREFSDMTYDDIASILGISPGTVKSRLARARASLAKVLVNQGTFDAPSRQYSRKGGEEHE